MNKKRFYQAGALACLLLLGAPGAEAAFKTFKADSDAGANALDYIENRRRARRAAQLTEDQKQLQKDVAEMRKNLRQPLKPGDKQPVSVEGDDMFYDQATGAVYARGNVRVTELDGKRVTTQRVDGNLKTTEYKVEDLAHMVQMTPGMKPMTMDGYQLIYNFTTKQGTAENVHGKNGNRYFYGKHMEFYPEKIVLYDGWQSECGAQKPHYRLSGKIIEFFDEYMVIHKARYYLGSVCLYGKDEIIKRYDQQENNNFPNVGYDSDDGLQLRWNLERDLLRNTRLYAQLYYRTGNTHRINGLSDGFKNIYGLEWKNAGNTFTLEDGQYEDDKDRWVRKHPTMKYSYSHAVGKLPLNYTVSYENGNWSQTQGTQNITSRHQVYSASLSHNPIYLFDRRTWLNLSTGYSITKESYLDSETKGWDYSAMLFREFSDKFTVFAGYKYSNATTSNSVFSFGDIDSYSKKYNYGFSLELGKHDRVMMSNEMDASTGTRQEIDYFWFHDFHCMTGILKYRERTSNDRNGTVTFKLQFTPW